MSQSPAARIGSNEKSRKTRGVVAICPRCECKHRVTENWTGRGVLRRYCSICIQTVERTNTLMYPVVGLHYNSPKPH